MTTDNKALKEMTSSMKEMTSPSTDVADISVITSTLNPLTLDSSTNIDMVEVDSAIEDVETKGSNERRNCNVLRLKRKEALALNRVASGKVPGELSCLIPGLLYRKKGELHQCESNIVTLFESGLDEELNTFKLWKNLRSGKIMMGKESLSDGIVCMIQIYLQKRGMPSVSIGVVDRAIRMVAERRGVDPLKDELLKIYDRYKDDPEWEDMLSGWLVRWWGISDTGYYREVAKRWMIGLVSRGVDMGCVMDMMIVLEGPQGIGKSRFCKEMVGEEWYTCMIPTNDRDVLLSMRGKWLIELDEMNRLARRTTAEELKSFLSAQEDSYRDPYGMTANSWKRGCVVVGTTNDHEWLQDVTGNRRMWPIILQDEVLNVEVMRQERERVLSAAIRAKMLGETFHVKLDSDVKLMLGTLRNDKLQSTGLEEFIELAIDGQRGLLAIGYKSIRNFIMGVIGDRLGEYRGTEIGELMVLNGRGYTKITKAMLKCGWQRILENRSVKMGKKVIKVPIMFVRDGTHTDVIDKVRVIIEDRVRSGEMVTGGIDIIMEGDIVG